MWTSKFSYIFFKKNGPKQRAWRYGKWWTQTLTEQWGGEIQFVSNMNQPQYCSVVSVIDVAKVKNCWIQS